jgi:uncharacterized protein with von Willebrand factor type A (vWA) domain
MTSDNLMDLLGLDDDDQPGSGPDILPIGKGSEPAADGKPAPVPQPTALQLDRWGLRRGSDALIGTKRLGELFNVDADDVNIYEAGLAVADFVGAAFEPEPQLHDACTDEVRHEYMKMLLETPDYRELHAGTQLDTLASEIAATAFAESYQKLKRKREHEERKQEKGLPGLPGEKGKGSPLDGEMEVMGAVAEGLEEAKKDVEEFRESQSAFGMGAGPGGGTTDPKAIAALYKRIRKSDTLRKIVELAGRFRRLAQAKQRQKAHHGYEDLVGVRLDDKVELLLSEELACLCDADLELDTIRRLQECETLASDYSSVEQVAKGPVIFCVDESGSMSGQRVHTAKALALAMAWIARKQKRWCALVAYSGDTGERILPLPPGKWNEIALTDWLEQFLSGGTNIDVPVREMPRIYAALKAPEGKTDVVFVTDAICHIPDAIQTTFLAWKKAAKARLITLIIGGWRSGESLARLSDETHLIPEISVEEDAVGRVLSI